MRKRPPPGINGRRAKWWIAAALLLLVAYWGALWSFQRELLFPRPPLAGVAALPPGARQIWLSIPGARVEAWYLPPAGAAAREPAPLLMYFHGNGELIDFSANELAEPRRLGIAALLVEYPGYGRSSGSPSQESITRAALAAYDWATAQPFVDRTRVVAYGRSLGGGVATILASKRPIAALVLESTFTSVRSFAHQFFAPEFAVRDPFDSLSLIGAYEGPVLVLHGDHDELIPPRHAKELARAARRAELRFLSCGHNDCPRSWSTVRQFLVTSGVLARNLPLEDR